MPSRWPFILLASVALASGALTAPSDITRPQDTEFRIRAEVELVLLDVSVRNSSGSYVTGLSKDQFQVFENGVPQKITEFGVADAPVTIGLVMDDSGSMSPHRAGLNAAGVAFVEASNPRDEMFVVNFNDKVRRGLPEAVPFTDNVDLLRSALSKHKPEGRTALYDAVSSGIKQLETGRNERKALVVVTDGGDNCSRNTMKDVMRQIEESAATLYTVGIFGPEDPDRNPGLLKRIAGVSGGECFLPADFNSIEPVCRRIAKDIRSRYTLGYRPTRTSGHAGERKIRVVAVSPEQGKLQVRTRTSYRLPERVSAD